MMIPMKTWGMMMMTGMTKNKMADSETKWPTPKQNV